MEFTILENGLDSLNEAINYYIKGKEHNDERSFKFCILLLDHCAELLLKEILHKAHEVLIYDNIDTFKIEDPQTVGFKTALMRVEKICKVNLFQYKNYLLDLSNLRNKITHYKFSITLDWCTQVILNSISAIEYIMHSILHKTFEEFNNILDNKKIKQLHNYADVCRKKKDDINRDIENNNLIRISVKYNKVNKPIYIPCCKCGENYLVLDGANISCKFCGAKFPDVYNMLQEDINEVISSHMSREIGKKKEVLGNICRCNNCDNNTLIFSSICNKWICLVCGYSFDSISCHFCDKEFPDIPDGYTLAESHDNTNESLFLCTECGQMLKDNLYDSMYYRFE